MPLSLLDTDSLSEIIKGRNQTVLQHASAYLALHGVFTFSLITRYEILRGLKAKNATTQINLFDQCCRSSHILPITDEIIVRGADIYAELKQQGELISDADILIASTAQVHGLTLVTNNLSHFQRINGLSAVSWVNL